MKKTSLLIFLTAILIFSMIIAGCGTSSTPQSPGDAIKIGSSLPLSGAFATFGEGAKFGLQAAVDDINKSGGVTVNGKKIPIQLIVKDNQSDPTKASSTASDLILTDNVSALAGIGSPVLDIPISTTADRYQTPFLTAIPFEPWWQAGPYKFAWSSFFRIGTPIPSGDPRSGKPGYTLAEEVMNVTKDFKDQTNNNVAVFATNDSDGTAWYTLFPGILKSNGYNPVGADSKLGLVPPGTVDFSSIISQWKKDDAQILWANSPPPDMAVLLRQMDSQGFKPKLITASRALLFSEDVQAVGGNIPQGVMAEMWWYPNYPADQYPGIGGTTAASLAKRYTDTHNNSLNLGIGNAYSLMQVLNDAIQRAGSLDRNAINDAIAKTDLNTVAGLVKFTDTHDSPMPSLIGQWVKNNNVWLEKLVYSPIPSIKPDNTPLFPYK